MLEIANFSEGSKVPLEFVLNAEASKILTSKEPRQNLSNLSAACKIILKLPETSKVPLK